MTGQGPILVIVALVALVLIWTSMANLAPAEILLPQDAFDLGHLARFEISGASPGTTTFGEYMPATLKGADPLSFRAPAKQQPNSAVPEVRLIQHTGTDWLLSVVTTATVSIPLHIFYLPGWHATIDGAPASIQGSTALDLLTVDVPAGNHQVRLYIESTAVQQTGILVSLISALIVLALLALALWRRETDTWMPALAGALVLVVFGAPSVVALSASPQPLQPLRTGVSPNLNLIGLSASPAQVETDGWHVASQLDPLHLRVYWQVKDSGLAATVVTWRLVDDAGHVWAQRAQLPRYGTALQSAWVPNEIVQDDYDLPLAGNMPAGRYMLQVSPAPNQKYVTVAPIQLDTGSPPAVIANLSFGHPIDALLGGHIRLLGFNAPTNARPGQPYVLTLYWQAEGDVQEDYTGSVQLLDPCGKLVAQHDSITGDGFDPSSLWLPGRPTAERQQLELPLDLKPGMYTLITLLYRLSNMQRLPVMLNTGPSVNNAVVLSQVQLEDGGPNILEGKLEGPESNRYPPPGIAGSCDAGDQASLGALDLQSLFSALFVLP